MKRVLSLVVCFAIIALGNRTAIAQKGYRVDASIQQKVDTMMQNVDPRLGAVMAIELYMDDSLVLSNFASDKKISAISYADRYKDTINIMCFVGMAAKMGCALKLYGDTCEAYFLMASDAPIFKYKKDDTTLDFGLRVHCAAQSVVLNKVPDFNGNDELVGSIVLQSDPFWEKSNGREEKVNVSLYVYFRTNKIKVLGQ